MYKIETLKSCAEDRNREYKTANASMIGRGRRFLLRGWRMGRTRLLLGWRLGTLGSRSALGWSLQVNNPRAVAIGSGVTICGQFVLADLCRGQGEVPKIIIVDGCTILYRFQCNAAHSVRIGRNVLVASNVLINDSDHVVEPGGVPVTKNNKFITRPVFIDDNCWIGQNAVILKGVTIGREAIVGASSVVTHDVPSCSGVTGNPARVIRKLEISPKTN